MKSSNRKTTGLALKQNTNKPPEYWENSPRVTRWTKASIERAFVYYSIIYKHFDN